MRDKQLALIEAIANTFTGLVLSIFVIQPVVFRAYEIELTFTTNVSLAVVFTIVSILRGYVWRRWFHKRFY